MEILEVSVNGTKMKKEINISGMHCPSCAMLIEEELQDKVNEVKVDLKKGKAFLDFDEKKISKQTIKKIIESLGYKVLL